MRGLQVSRPLEELVAEARALDGRRRSGNQPDRAGYHQLRLRLVRAIPLARLLRALLKVKGLRWLRLLYAYPKFLTAEVLDVLAGDERCCRTWICLCSIFPIRSWRPWGAA